MKRFMLLIILTSFLMGCTSMHEDKKSVDVTKARSFGYYFNSSAVVREFSTLDEAYEYIKMAQYVLKKSINKTRQQGLSAQLNGPIVKKDQPVVVAYFITAGTTKGGIDISNKSDTLESILKEAISVSSVFMVFNKEKGVSISDFYVMDGYSYTSNSQYKSFKFENNIYNTEYPVGWGINQAFQYLKQEKL